MEIKHRRQLFTGKMIAQVRDDALSLWRDATIVDVKNALHKEWKKGFDDGHCVGLQDKNAQANGRKPHNGVQPEGGLATDPAAPFVNLHMLATGGFVSSEGHGSELLSRSCFVVPHHGRGLLAVEESFRDDHDGDTPKMTDDQLRAIVLLSIGRAALHDMGIPPAPCLYADESRETE